MNAIPTLMTERLTLRPYTADDFGPYAAFLASAHASFMGGPHNTDLAWSWFTNDIAQWHLYGYGNLAVTDRSNGALLGFVGVTKGPAFPEAQLGWFLLPEAHGKGIASESAAAMLVHIFAACALNTIVSYIDPKHSASIALAQRIGGTLDPDAKSPANEPCAVYRHHPQTEAMQ